MADEKKSFDLGDLTFKVHQYKSATGTEQLKFRVWGGEVRLGVYKDGEFKPIFERPLNDEKLFILVSRIEELIKASPDFKDPIVFSSMDRETKKIAPEWVLVLVKDAKMVYHIEVQIKGGKYDFPLKGPFGISYGSNPLQEAEKSAISLKALVNWFKTRAPLECVVSNKKKDPSSFNNNGARPPQGGGGAKAPSDDDDSYFS